MLSGSNSINTRCARANIENAEVVIVVTSSSEYVSFVAARLNWDSTKMVAILGNGMQHLASAKKEQNF